MPCFRAEMPFSINIKKASINSGFERGEGGSTREMWEEYTPLYHMHQFTLKIGLFGSITPKPVDQKSPEWSQTLLLCSLSTGDMSKVDLIVSGIWVLHQLVGMPQLKMEKKHISSPHKIYLRGFIPLIVLFDHYSQEKTHK